MALTTTDLGVVGDGLTGVGLAGRLRINSPDAATTILLEAAITSASRMVERFCGRSFSHNAAQVDRVHGFGTTELIVHRPPVLSITSIAFDGETIPAADYSCVGDDAEGGVIVNEQGWINTTMMRAPGAARPDLPDHEQRLYVVTYKGGYEGPNQSATTAQALPADVQEAVYKAASYLYQQMASDPTVRGESLMEYSVQYGNVGDSVGTSGLPLVVEHMLRAHVIAHQA